MLTGMHRINILREAFSAESDLKKKKCLLMSQSHPPLAGRSTVRRSRNNQPFLPFSVSSLPISKTSLESPQVLGVLLPSPCWTLCHQYRMQSW